MKNSINIFPPFNNSSISDRDKKKKSGLALPLALSKRK